MPKLVFDPVGEHEYQEGVQECALFLSTGEAYTTGVAWNGLIGLDENPTGAEAQPFYANNKKYLNLLSKEEFGGTIHAYTYPEEFKKCLGYKEVAKGLVATGQTHVPFGLAYKVGIGSDDKASYEKGYEIHLVYGALAKPVTKGYKTQADSAEPMQFDFEFTTTPVDVPGCKPTATLVISSKTADPENLKAFEEKIYGDSSEGTATLPSPEEVIALFPEVM